MFPVDALSLASVLDARLVGDPEAKGERVRTDTRAGMQAGDIFVGIVGPRFDGGRFAARALDEGATIAVIGEDVDEPPVSQGTALLVVADPLCALQRLAASARDSFKGTLVAITGSNGKTIVKEMLRAMLATTLSVDASPMSYNSQVGVALTLLSLDPDADVAIVECGISMPGEMARLQAMVRPDVGVFTNVGSAHIEGLGSRKRIAAEKALLFADVPADGWVLSPADEKLAHEAMSALGVPIAFVDLDDPAVSEDAIAPVGDDPLLRADAIVAAAAAALLGVSDQDVARGLSAWRPSPMRLEMSTTPRGIMLINDAYTSDPVSADAALRALVRERLPGGQAIAVLGGMAQLGPASDAAHRSLGQRVVELGVDRLIGVGAGGRAIAAAARGAGLNDARIHEVRGVAEAADVLDAHAKPGDRVLLKASRPDRLERLAAILFEAVAPARLFVDLDAIVANYDRVRAVTADGVGAMAVVKSFGYGLDATRLARALERAAADYFAVAYPDEGVRLRDGGVTCPILVQNVLPFEVDKVVRYGLTAQVGSTAQIAWLADEGKRQQRPVRVHLKIDTGMGRGGVFADEAVDAARRIDVEPWLNLEGLMTHFAAADDPAHDAFTRRQIATFDGVRAALDEQSLTPRWTHACNSAGIVRFPEAHYNMVRIGIGLYGYSEAPDDLQAGFEPVMRLVTRVVSVKELPAGHAVGYGLTYRAQDNPRRIAVVAVGYNDGYPWALSNQGWMAVRGVRCPVVGRVCMDVTMLDVTGLDDIEPGEEVVVYGRGPDEPSPVALARLAGTIPYELLTRLSPRIRRIFRSSH